MGVEHSLACHRCFTFLATGKWPLLVEFDGHFPRGSAGRPAASDRLREGVQQAMGGGAFHHWAAALAPAVLAFMALHEHHDLRIHDDCGDEPWTPEEPGCFRWKEHPGYCTDELFLPRNLIEDLGLRTWRAAWAHLSGLDMLVFIPEPALAELERVFRLGVLALGSSEV